MEYARKNLGAKSFNLGVFVNNTGALKCYEFVGFVIEKNEKDGGYALVDFYQIHKSILNYKNFVSISGNNINHPNDWLIRVYAQNILATMLDYNKLYK